MEVYPPRDASGSMEIRPLPLMTGEGFFFSKIRPRAGFKLVINHEISENLF